MTDIEELKKENPFEVPEGYFDQLQSEVMEKVSRHRKLVRLRKIITLSVAVAAVAVLLISINWNIFNPEMNDNNVAQTEAAPEKLFAADNGSYSFAYEDCPEVDIEECNFDNVDDQILDYYDDEMSQIDYYY